MFNLFKSKERREKETHVDKIGQDIFRQIALFRDKCLTGEFTSDIFTERVNHSYTAGYLIGFIDEKLSILFDREEDKAKYMTTIITRIFPKTGLFLIKSKYQARVIAEDLRLTDHVKKIEKYADEFDIGMENGRRELLDWEADIKYTPHLLIDFFLTGNTNNEKPSY